MAIEYNLTPELRIKLKKPLGTLIRGSFAEAMKTFKDITENEKPTAIISVGDTVSKNLAENHLVPQVSIVDNKVMRRRITPIALAMEKTITVKNPKGTITEEAHNAIREAMKCDYHVKIVVDGEEDLLALIAVLYAPENSFVVYGQPYEGIVAIKVTPEKKSEIAEILKTMEKRSKS
jgi:uncharacterized protein (UPF0218 family)